MNIAGIHIKVWKCVGWDLVMEPCWRNWGIFAGGDFLVTFVNAIKP